jgi:hypothetical protein
MGKILHQYFKKWLARWDALVMLDIPTKNRCCVRVGPVFNSIYVLTAHGSCVVAVMSDDASLIQHITIGNTQLKYTTWIHAKTRKYYYIHNH